MTRIVIDACCLINLAAADAFSAWLPQLGLTWMLPQAVADEALFLRACNDQGEPIREPIDLKPHLDSGLFQRVAPEGPAEMAAFVAHARVLDDSEAMALAIAQSRGWMLATDDRKAITVACSVQVAVCGTAELIKCWADTADVTDLTIGETLLRIKRRARYIPNVRDPLCDWWMGYLTGDFEK